jgi:hypothetical protein
MIRKRLRTWVLLALAALTTASVGVSANASTPGHDQGIRLFSRQDPSLGFAPNGNGFVVLTPLTAAGSGKWNVTEINRPNLLNDAVYTNVATGSCLAARSPIDGVALTMATCDTSDPYQQWERWADRLVNVSTRRCIRPDAVAAGARLYQEVCNQSDRTTEFSDDFRVKLAAVSGDGQQIPAGRAGQPLVVRITDENDQPLAGFSVIFELRGPRFGEDFDISPATFGPGSSTRTAVTSNAQGLATTAALTGKANTRNTFSAVLSVASNVFVLQTVIFTGAVV